MATKKKKKVTKRRKAAKLLRKKKIVKPAVPPVDPTANPAAPEGVVPQGTPGMQPMPQGYGV